MTDAAKSIREDVLVLCHGGPIAEPSDAAFILSKVTDLADSMEQAAWNACQQNEHLRSRFVNSCD